MAGLTDYDIKYIQYYHMDFDINEERLKKILPYISVEFEKFFESVDLGEELFEKRESIKHGLFKLTANLVMASIEYEYLSGVSYLEKLNVQAEYLENEEYNKEKVITITRQVLFPAAIYRLGLEKTSEKLNEIQKTVEEYENIRRTFPLRLLRKIKEIESTTRNDIPKPTQLECLILANRELKLFTEEDLFINGNYTQTALSIRDSYKAQKKNL